MAFIFPNEKSSPIPIILNLGLPIYNGIFGILHIDVYCGIATVSWHHSQNCRLFRFATVSWHYRHSQIAVYFGLPEYHGNISYFRSPLISAYLYIWHHRYYQITLYFGSAKVSRHWYSSHIIKHLIVVACDGLAIYHGYPAISVSEASSHLYLDSMSRTVPRLITSISWFGKPSNTSAQFIV